LGQWLVREALSLPTIASNDVSNQVFQFLLLVITLGIIPFLPTVRHLTVPQNCSGALWLAKKHWHVDLTATRPQNRLWRKRSLLFSWFVLETTFPIELSFREEANSANHSQPLLLWIPEIAISLFTLLFCQGFDRWAKEEQQGAVRLCIPDAPVSLLRKHRFRGESFDPARKRLKKISSLAISSSVYDRKQSHLLIVNTYIKGVSLKWPNTDL